LRNLHDDVRTCKQRYRAGPRLQTLVQAA